ncbi:hypothetical protein SDC9_166260 [bioreactor metagenome]|uniref:Uncharacterized protein n=1 Tax=bioreactor metagenome TaxID=1076179 RepID=A0A645FWS3_9ZZZZ
MAALFAENAMVRILLPDQFDDFFLHGTVRRRNKIARSGLVGDRIGLYAVEILHRLFARFPGDRLDKRNHRNKLLWLKNKGPSFAKASAGSAANYYNSTIPVLFNRTAPFSRKSRR